MSSSAALWQGQATLIPVVNAAGNILEEWQVATTSQTVFTLASFTYTPGTHSIHVFKNGLILRLGVDYTETDASHITLLSAAALNDKLLFWTIAITTAVGYNGGGVPVGGLAGQALTKINASDYNTQWTDLSALASLLDAPRVNLAVSVTPDLVTGFSNVTRNVQFTAGTGPISGFVINNGNLFAARAAVAFTLTNSASLTTQTNADIAVQIGDTFLIRATAANAVEILAYAPAISPVAKGGTGAIAAAAARSNLGVMDGTINPIFRNRARNGNMRLNQRAAGVITAANGFAVDGYTIDFATAATINVQQVLGYTTAGINSFYRLTSLAVTSPAAGAYWRVNQCIEGLNVSDFDLGQATAKSITISFKVRSSLVGTYSVFARNSAGNRSYVTPFTINSANTWEKKTVTILGDVTGTWLTDTGIGLQVGICVAIGTTYATTAGSWQAGNFLGMTGQTNLVSVNGATFDVTEFQVEEGTVATPFERRDPVVELGLCQRYYENGTHYAGGYGAVSTGCYSVVPFRVAKRALGGTIGYTSLANANVTTFDARDLALTGMRWYCTVTAAGGWQWDGTWTIADSGGF